MHSDGSESILVHETHISEPCRSPNGDKIAFINEDRNIILINANGNSYGMVNELPGACMDLCWSDDGRYLPYYRAVLYL